LILGFLKEEEREIIVDAIQITQEKVGNTIIKEGDQGDQLFLVASGEYECFKFLGGK
jgi:CRP-like cAMP-binding protein